MCVPQSLYICDVEPHPLWEKWVGGWDGMNHLPGN